jgi:DNA-binding HxlR family transcriptional regulator
VKRYGQWCGVAQALDVVGDRWAMLIVRDLLFGPQRYSDLLAGLPGIGTTVLAERLRTMQKAGVVTRRMLPPPAASAVYELTEPGQALRPVLAALWQWGVRSGSRPMPGDIDRPSWMLLSLLATGRTLTAGRSCELRVDGEVFTVSAAQDGPAVQAGADRHTPAAVTIAVDDLASLMTGRRKGKALRSRVRIEGDETAALELLTLLEGALAPPSTTPAAAG